MSKKIYREKAKTGESQHAGVRRYARQLLAIAIVGVMVMGSLLVKVEAWPGYLDTTFSLNGRQTTGFPAYNNPYSVSPAYDVAIQDDGKIVVAGSTDFGTGSHDFAVTRYNKNGTLDVTFSGDGKQTTDFSNGSDRARAVAIQSDGKIVVGGFTRLDGNDGPINFALARYNSNGTLDTGFSTDGKQTTDFGEDNDIRAIAIQTDGKIVVAGRTFSDPTPFSVFAVARYNKSGTLDVTFSGDGKQIADFSGKAVANAVAIQSNGKIVVAGYTYNFDDPSISDFAVARYNKNGTLDVTFSGDGKQTTDFSDRRDRANAVAIQSNDKIVVAGSTDPSFYTSNFALARYNPNGALDTSFGTGGMQTTNFGSIDKANAIAIQSDGKIVAAGAAYNGSNTNLDFALARYNSDGKLDTTFHGDGKQTTGFFSGSGDSAEAIAIQTDGKIVVAGGTRISGGNLVFAVARYHWN